MSSTTERRHGTSPATPDIPATPAITRSTVPQTLRWFWSDTLFRLLPFALAVAIYARFWAGGLAGVGLVTPELGRDLGLGLAIGLPLGAAAIIFRGWVAPWYRLPTAGDQALQTFFYLALNAPIEELFWRGMLQTAAIWGVGTLLGAGALASGIGWALVTAIFGVYHRLGKWSWRSVAGVTLAGGIFGLAYLLQPAPRSIWLPTIIHGVATAAFLSWGDAALHYWKLARVRLGRRTGA